MNSKRKNVTGKKFNCLTAIKFLEKRKDNKNYWLCRCDCGNETIVRISSLATGQIKSCGCLIGKSKVHGYSNSKLYKKWSSIKQRCYNKKHVHFKNYGGRGIAMCDEWLNDPSAFIEYINKNLGKQPTENHTIDRINNDSDYKPNNLRWATKSQQNANQRVSKKTIVVNWFGISKPLYQLADAFSVNRRTANSRYHRNLDLMTLLEIK